MTNSLKGSQQTPDASEDIIPHVGVFREILGAGNSIKVAINSHLGCTERSCI